MNTLKQAAPLILIALIFSVIAFLIGSHRQDSTVQELNRRLSESAKTVEVKQGLYETAIGQVTDVKSLLDSSSQEVVELKRQLDESKAKVLTAQKVVVLLKSPLSAPTTATQQTVPPVDAGGKQRQRVDFTHDFGPFKVSGHTLTDPAEGFVTLSQGRPLSLTVAVARNSDGTWSSLVTSSEPTVGVNVSLGSVDPGVISPSWYQRIWAVGSASVLSSPAAGLSLAYFGERFSLGPQCQVWNGGWGCGVSMGFRIFR